MYNKHIMNEEEIPDSEDQKAQQKRWKEEADQLKKDLKKRPKQVQVRKVPIKFGGLAKTKKPPSSGPSPMDSDERDAFLRRQLGL
ncbi:MAG: hypothetical protein CL521_02845 [Actinobacteria bacterium]|nr:hypothetical protein [Actinomycetota bacterium]|tara:strand:- start:185 stop:439 length:255 start_codon:yes stop_codon:yes gene_type:complete